MGSHAINIQISNATEISDYKDRVYRPSVSINEKGQFSISYHQSNLYRPSAKVMFSSYDFLGEPITEKVLVSDGSVGRFNAKLRVLDNSRVLVFWEEGNSRVDLRAKVLSFDGNIIKDYFYLDDRNGIKKATDFKILNGNAYLGNETLFLLGLSHEIPRADSKSDENSRINIFDDSFGRSKSIDIETSSLEYSDELSFDFDDKGNLVTIFTLDKGRGIERELYFKKYEKNSEGTLFDSDFEKMYSESEKELLSGGPDDQTRPLIIFNDDTSSFFVAWEDVSKNHIYLARYDKDMKLLFSKEIGVAQNEKAYLSMISYGKNVFVGFLDKNESNVIMRVYDDRINMVADASISETKGISRPSFSLNEKGDGAVTYEVDDEIRFRRFNLEGFRYQYVNENENRYGDFEKKDFDESKRVNESDLAPRVFIKSPAREENFRSFISKAWEVFIRFLKS